MIFEILHEGKTIRAQAQWLNGKCWIHLNGKTFLYQSEKEKSKLSRNKSLHESGGNLLAPMPGKVTKILKQVDAKVSQGDVVLVMEAMKMEYTLKSAGPGVIKKINCSEGSQVALGQVLVEIREKEDSSI